VIEKGGHLLRSHLRRVPPAGEIDKPLDPVNIGFLGAVAVMTPPNRVAHAIEYLGA
jgi:hypothetical protein